MQLPIVFSTDDNYILPLSVAIQSLKNHKKKHVKLEIYIFYEKLKEENMELLKLLNSKGCNLNFVNVSKFFKDKGLYSVEYFSIAMYYRLVAPLILSQYEKIIYLDCDIIVKSCISELYSVDLKDNIIAAVHDVFFSRETYVNSGVVLFNVKKYNDNMIFDKCLKYIQQQKDLAYPDQDTLNYVCKEKIYFLKYSYNYFSKSVLGSRTHINQQGINSIGEIRIIHFVTDKKPWLYKNFPFSNLWWKEVKKLPKVIKKEVYAKYKRNLKKDKFDDGAFKFMFGSKIYQFFIKTRIKLNTVFNKSKNDYEGKDDNTNSFFNR